MVERIVIDGNNLLHAMHAHAPIPLVGRETMVKVIERWAREGEAEVTLIFDGAPPRGGLSKQMSSTRIMVCFSSPASADDTIIKIVHQTKDPASLRVVTNDKAISYEARRRRCRHTSPVDFIAELFPPQGETRGHPAAAEKPERVEPQEAQELLDLLDGGGDETDPPNDLNEARK